MKKVGFIAGIMLGTVGATMILRNEKVNKMMQKFKN